jgi:hypothetical protein
VHAGVGAPGASSAPAVAQNRSGPGEDSLDGADLGLVSPHVEPGAVMRDDSLPSAGPSSLKQVMKGTSLAPGFPGAENEFLAGAQRRRDQR